MLWREHAHAVEHGRAEPVAPAALEGHPHRPCVHLDGVWSLGHPQRALDGHALHTCAELQG